jgi:A/G-specific adenine glycosylase
VASFAYERRAALVDTNVARVLKRVFAPAVNVKTTSGSRTVWRIAESILPRTGRATWTHNQALMELGALVCTARVAHCGRCPVRGVCRSAKPRDRVAP